MVDIAPVIDWAQREMNQHRFVLSIAPTNGPSLAVARKLTFQKIGSWNDPEEGLEDVYKLDILEAPHRSLPFE